MRQQLARLNIINGKNSKHCGDLTTRTCEDRDDGAGNVAGKSEKGEGEIPEQEQPDFVLPPDLPL